MSYLELLPHIHELQQGVCDGNLNLHLLLLSWVLWYLTISPGVTCRTSPASSLSQASLST